MGFFSNPKFVYFLRIAQLLVSLGFLILICYAGVHRGWWKNINGAIAVGGKDCRYDGHGISFTRLTLVQ